MVRSQTFLYRAERRWSGKANEVNEELTIGDLAKAAGLNVETIRYYQKRGLICEPKKPIHGYRRYAINVIEQLKFIKSAQSLNFSLNEIKELLEMSAGSLDKTQIRNISQIRLTQVRETKKQLIFVENTLKRWIGSCEESSDESICPIIENIRNGVDDSTTIDAKLAK